MRNSFSHPDDVVISLEKVTLRAGTRFAFPRTNWTIHAGEQWAILGPNNSGKSLLAAVLAGEVTPVRGEVNPAWPAGTDSQFSKPAVLVSPHTHRAVANAESSFYQSRWHSGLGEGHFTAGQFLSQEHVEEINPFEVNPSRTPRQIYLARRRAGIRLLRLAPLLRRRLLCLSNGEMRRTLLAQALCHAPRLLVLDEPFAGLDAATRRHLARVIETLMRDGMQIVVATARPDEIPAGTTHLLLVSGRQVVAQGTTTDLLNHPLVQRLRTESIPATPPVIRRKSDFSSGRQTADAPIVEITNATVQFGSKKILHRVSWTIRRGEHWVLLGPNGSGKTTLLSLIQGDNPQAYAQDLRLFGLTPDSTQTLWRARRHIGWLSPELHLHYPPEWNCLDVVCSGFFDSMGLFEHCTSHQRQMAGIILRQLGLSRRARLRLGELSLGDQRLVLLARALAKRPQLLVLDEPCQALDSSHRRLVLTTVDHVAMTSGLSLIFVTHHRREIPACMTHLLRLKAGRVVYRGGLI